MAHPMSFNNTRLQINEMLVESYQQSFIHPKNLMTLESFKMSIDLGRESLLTLNQAGKLLPDGARPSSCTWWRWATRGVKGVVLETIQIGNRKFTTREALQRFADQLSGKGNGGRTATSRTASQSDRAVERAETELESEGI
jgi:hypothetical protein